MQERRLFPRYPFEQSVLLHGTEDAQLLGRTIDISMAGVGLLLTREAALALAQGGSVLTPGDRFRLTLDTAAKSGKAKPLSLECRVERVRRLSQEEYLAGALFAEPDTSSEEALAALIQRLAR